MSSLGIGIRGWLRSGVCSAIVGMWLAGLALSSLGAQTVLIDFGSEWSFFRGSTEPSSPPTAWRNPGFDDSSWESGLMGIGYGDDDDATILDDMRQDNAADPPVPGYLTVYCRRTINVANPAAFATLLLTVDYDDSFIFYINGQEVARDNIGTPLVEVAYNTTADGNHDAGTPEYFDIIAGLAYLEVGTNVIAIEGHNTSLTSTDFSLNARLSANDPRGDCPSGLTCTKGPAGVTLSWTATADYDSIAVTRDGAALAGSPFTDSRTSVVDSSPGDYSNLYSVIATIDGVQCPELTCTTTPDYAFIDAGDEWRFFRGTAAPSTPAEAWRAAAFGDSAWETGPTGIGYGDDDDATVLGDMQQIADDPDTVEDESQPGYLSVFCRKSFQLGRLPPITNLILEVDYDDGFIAFLNGEEVARSASMGSAGVEFAFDDPADAGREAGTAEQFDLTARSSLLVQGTNVLAVQVHNRPITSTDLSFIPRLVVNVCPSVSGLTCAYDGAMDDVTLTFSLSAAADSVAVTRNGEPLPGSPFDPATTTVVDSSPGAFDNEYEVIPIFGSFSCGARSCTVECGDRDTGALTCVLSLVGGVTQAQLTWPTRAGAESIEVQREGALLATLPPSATSYLDPDVESDQPEGDTDYSVVFIFPSGDECTYSCAPICMIPSLVCTAVDGGGLYRPQLTWGPIIKEWESFTILRDGVEIATGLPGDAALYTDEDVDLIFGVAYDYELVPIAPAGEEVTDTCSTLTCTVSGPVDEAGSYDEPAGGWDYFIDFEALGSLQYNPVPGVEGNLDGDWVRSVDYDSWDGSAPDEFGAAPAGLAPGGLELRDVVGGGACGGAVKVLRILNPGNTTDPSAGTSVDEQFPDPYDEPNNSEILLAIDTGIADRNLLRDGVTFAARWRAHPEPPEYLNANPTGDGTPLDGGVGQIGFYFVDEPGDAGLGDEGGLAFSLQSSADSGQMQMSTNPAVTLPAAHIDVFRSIWVTVEDPEGDDTYDITVYVNGDETPFQSYTVTDAALQAGDPDFGAPVGNYLAIGVPGVNQDGDIEIDYVGYKAGVHAPTSTPCASGGARFVRGDADSNGTVNLTDGIRILSFLFTGGPAPECMDAADVDDSGGPQPAITDAIRLFGWLYLGQAAPAAPSPSAPTYAAGDCGIDPPGGPADTMDCVTPGPVCR